MSSKLKMNPKYQCPACHSDDIIEFDEYIHCLNCNLEFFKESIDNHLDEEDLLSEEELQGISNAFSDELSDREKRKKFLKSLDRDLL